MTPKIKLALAERFKQLYGNFKRVVIDAGDGDLASFVAMKIAVYALGQERVVVLHHRENPNHPSIESEWRVHQGERDAPTFVDLSGLLSQIARPRPIYDLVGANPLQLDPILWGQTPAAEELWDDAVAIVIKRMGADVAVVNTMSSDDLVLRGPGAWRGPSAPVLKDVKSGEMARFALGMGYPASSYMRVVLGELRSTRWNVAGHTTTDRMQTVVCPVKGEYVSRGFYEAAAEVVRAAYDYDYGLMEDDSAQDFLRFLVLGEGDDEWDLDAERERVRALIKDIKDKEALISYVLENRVKFSKFPT